MVWTAALNTSGNEIVITRNSDGVDYRSDSYPLAHLQCRKWVESTRNYLALILLERNEVVITITDDPFSTSLGNTLLGSAVPATAYASFTALAVAGGTSLVLEAATAATATNTATANSLQTAANVTLSSILSELASAKSFADLIVQDTVGTAFIRREVLNSSTNTRIIEIENFDGTLGAPVGVLLPIKQLRGDSVLERSYYAKVAGTGYLEGHSLSNVRVVDGETKAITNLGWFNVTTQTSITAPPVADIAGYEDLLEELVAGILAKLPAVGAKLSSQSLPVVLPTDLVLPLPIDAAKETTQLTAQAANLTQLQAANLALSLLGSQATLLEVKALSALIFDNTLIPEIRPLTVSDVVSVVLPPALTLLLEEIKTNTVPRFLAKATDSITVETAQLPASLGQKLAAESLAVALSSDTTLPLPAGAATALNQEEEILVLEAIGSNVALAATESTLLDIENRLIAIETNTLAPSIRPLSPTTDGVTVESTVLATIAKQNEQQVALDSIDDKLALAATESTLLIVRDKLAALEVNTLVPNSRPLTPAVDAVRVESATLATIAKQDEHKTVLTAIDQKLALTSTAGLQSAAIDKLDQILIQLSKAKEFEDLIVQDTEGNAFVRREVLNESANTREITIENFDGTLASPVGAVTTVKQVRGNNIVTRNYYAKVAGVGFAAGHSLSTMQIVNGETNAVTMLGWFNITTHLSIAAPEASEVAGYEDRIEELLTELVSQLPATLGAKLSAESLAVVLALDTVLPLPTGAATENGLTALLETIGILSDVSSPVADGDESTVKGLLRVVAKRALDIAAAQIATIGDATETDVAGSANDFGSLKSVLRGFWQDLDPTTVKSLLANIVNAAGNPNIRQLNSSDNVSIAALPGSVEADLAAIRTNTANISRYQYELAQTTAGLVFLVRIDLAAGTTTNISIATGLAFAPGSIEMSDPVVTGAGSSTKQILLNEYTARTSSAGNWVPDDILTRVLILDTATNAVSGTIWQKADGTILSTLPLLGVDVDDTDKTKLTILKSLLSSVGLPTDAVATADTGGAGQTLYSLLKRLLAKFQSGAQVAAAGLGISLPKKTYIIGYGLGVTSVSNLLDMPGAGATATDVSNFSSCELELRANGGALTYNVQTCYEPTFVFGVQTAEYQTAFGVSNASASLSAGQVLRLPIDLSRANYLRVQATGSVGTAGSTCTGVFSQQPSRYRSPVIVANGINVSGSVQTTYTSGSNSVELAGTITASATSGSFSQNSGISRCFSLNVSAISPGTTFTSEVQENLGSGWRTLYKFAPMSASGGQISPIFPASNNLHRYVEIVTGATPSVTRTVNRTQLNQSSVPVLGTAALGGFNVSDLPVYGKPCTIIANNQSAVQMFLQFHNSAAALTLGAIPVAGKVYPIASKGVVALGRADLDLGSTWASNTRLAISTTFSTYTAPAVVATPNQTFSLHLEVA